MYPGCYNCSDRYAEEKENMIDIITDPTIVGAVAVALVLFIASLFSGDEDSDEKPKSPNR